MTKETLNKITAAVIIGMGVSFVISCILSDLRGRAFEKQLLNNTIDLLPVVIPDDAAEI